MEDTCRKEKSFKACRYRTLVLKRKKYSFKRFTLFLSEWGKKGGGRGSSPSMWIGCDSQVLCHAFVSSSSASVAWNRLRAPPRGSFDSMERAAWDDGWHGGIALCSRRARREGLLSSLVFFKFDMFPSSLFSLFRF